LEEETGIIDKTVILLEDNPWPHIPHVMEVLTDINGTPVEHPS
jgi:hypothetical protein